MLLTEWCDDSDLIEQDDAGVLEDGAGDGHPLLLTATQLQASLTHLSVIT